MLGCLALRKARGSASSWALLHTPAGWSNLWVRIDSQQAHNATDSAMQLQQHTASSTAQGG